MVAYFLDAEDIEAAKLSATSCIDRFAYEQIWIRLESNETVHYGVHALVGCEITERELAGESTVFIARARESHVARDLAPCEAGDALTHHNRTWHNLRDHSFLGR